LHYQPVDSCQFTLRPHTVESHQQQQGIDGPAGLDGTSPGGSTGLENTAGSTVNGNVTNWNETNIESELMCEADNESLTPGDDDDKGNIIHTSQSHQDIGKLKPRFQSLPVLRQLSPSTATLLAVVCMTVFMVALLLLVLHGTQYLAAAAWWSIILLILLCAGLVTSFLVLLAYERNNSFTTFQVTNYNYFRFTATILSIVSLIISDLIAIMTSDFWHKIILYSCVVSQTYYCSHTM